MGVPFAIHKDPFRNSPSGLGLRHHASAAGDPTPGQGTKIPNVRQHSQKINKEPLLSTPKYIYANGVTYGRTPKQPQDGAGHHKDQVLKGLEFLITPMDR